MEPSGERAASIARLREMINGINIAMLTTVAGDGTLHSRPMATQEAEFDGTLWFFTADDTAKTGEIAQRRAVNVSYANAVDQRYVSLSGIATIVRDPGKAEQLWNPAYRAWFPEGLADPSLVLLRIDVEQAEYWDPGSSRMQTLAGFIRALATGHRPSGGEHGKMVLDTSGN